MHDRPGHCLVGVHNLPDKLAPGSIICVFFLIWAELVVLSLRRVFKLIYFACFKSQMDHLIDGNRSDRRKSNTPIETIRDILSSIKSIYKSRIHRDQDDHTLASQMGKDKNGEQRWSEEGSHCKI